MTAGDTATVDFALEPLTVSLAEIVVRPSRFSALKERPVPAATLSRESIETDSQISENEAFSRCRGGAC